MNLKETVQEALERYDRYTANENMTHAGAAQMVTDTIQLSLTALVKAANRVVIRYNQLVPMLALVCDEEILLDEAIRNLNNAVKEDVCK